MSPGFERWKPRVLVGKWGAESGGGSGRVGLKRAVFLRGIVAKERARHAREVNRWIRGAAERVARGS